MKKIIVCSKNTDPRKIFEEIQKSPHYLRRFVIIDGNIENALGLFEKFVNNLGCQQPPLLLLPNNAIIRPQNKEGSHMLHALYDTYKQNSKEGICVIITQAPTALIDHFEEMGVPRSEMYDYTKVTQMA